MTADRAFEHCTWCGSAVGRDDGYRAREHPGARKAVFCRLEHAVPWAMRGGHWDGIKGGRRPPSQPPPGGDPEATPVVAHSGDICVRCEEPLAQVRVTLVRHRGEHRIPDAFCSVDHMALWANAGGRYARPA